MNEITIKETIKIMEEESIKWFNKYPLPLMISAFDKNGDCIYLTETKDESSLIVLKIDNKLKKYWNLLKNNEFPEGRIKNSKLLEIYKNIPYRTEEQVSKDAIDSVKPIIIWKRLYMVWGLYIPIIIAIFEFYSPSWLAFFMMIYSIYKAIKAYRKSTGKNKLNKREEAEQEKERKMKDYYYHCEMNPKKFAELKLENFKNDSIDRVEKTFNSIK
ncbi:MAG: hypothetical protein WA945_10700 [Arcobacteraceae bacterium]